MRFAFLIDGTIACEDCIWEENREYGDLKVPVKTYLDENEQMQYPHLRCDGCLAVPDDNIYLRSS